MSVQIFGVLYEGILTAKDARPTMNNEDASSTSSSPRDINGKRSRNGESWIASQSTQLEYFVSEYKADLIALRAIYDVIFIRTDVL